MRKVVAFAGMVVASVGVAHAQTPVDERAAVRAETPWYERYTEAQAPGPVLGGLGPDDRRDAAGWRVNGRWGVTMNVRDEVAAERFAPIAPQDGAAVGAYFQINPNMRVGGQVSVNAAPQASIREDRTREADVRVQSAFRF